MPDHPVDPSFAAVDLLESIDHRPVGSSAQRGVGAPSCFFFKEKTGPVPFCLGPKDLRTGKLVFFCKKIRGNSELT